MKRLLFISLFILSSCNSDDNLSSANDSSLILGKWKLVSVGWLENGQEINMTEPEIAPCNIPYNLEFLSTGFVQVFSCNPYSNPIQYSDYSGNWIILNNGNVKNLSFEFPSNPESNSTHKITLIDSQKLRTHNLTYYGAIRVSHYQKVN